MRFSNTDQNRVELNNLHLKFFVSYYKLLFKLNNSFAFRPDILTETNGKGEKKNVSLKKHWDQTCMSFFQIFLLMRKWERQHRKKKKVPEVTEEFCPPGPEHHEELQKWGGGRRTRHLPRQRQDTICLLSFSGPQAPGALSRGQHHKRSWEAAPSELGHCPGLGIQLRVQPQIIRQFPPVSALASNEEAS